MFDGFGKLLAVLLHLMLVVKHKDLLRFKRQEVLLYISCLCLYIYIYKIFDCAANVFVNSIHSSFLTGVKRLTNNECKSFVTLSWVSRFNIIYI